MLTTKLKKAARRMFLVSDEELAREMGVRIETIEEWRRSPEFQAELRRLHREYKAAAARYASHNARQAAMKLGDLIEQKDPKLLLDTLKASGAFDYEEAEEKGVPLMAILERIREKEDNGGAA